MLSIDLIGWSWHVEVFGSAPESVIKVEVPHLPIQLVRTHMTFDEVIPCPLDGTQGILGLSCKQWEYGRNTLNMTYSGRSETCHNSYCSRSEVSVGKNGEVQEVTTQKFLSTLLFLVGNVELPSNERTTSVLAAADAVSSSVLQRRLGYLRFSVLCCLDLSCFVLSCPALCRQSLNMRPDSRTTRLKKPSLIGAGQDVYSATAGQSSWTLRCVYWQTVTDVSKDFSAFIFTPKPWRRRHYDPLKGL